MSVTSEFTPQYEPDLFVDRGDEIVNIWIEARKMYARGQLNQKTYRKHVAYKLIALADWYSSFLWHCNENGYFPSRTTYDWWLARNWNLVFDCLPGHEHAELVWMPGLENLDLDDASVEIGLKSQQYNSNYVEDVLPGRWLTNLLMLANLDSEVLFTEAPSLRHNGGEDFVKRFRNAGFTFKANELAPPIMNAEQVITIIENAYSHAIACSHIHVNVRALMSVLPSEPLIMQTDRHDEVHIGLHSHLNGAGHMETAVGRIVVPAGDYSFVGANRWSYGISKTYGLALGFFYASNIKSAA